MTISLMRRLHPIGPIRRLLNPSPEVTATITDQTAPCPRDPEGTVSMERCMHCDRLIVLHVDADGNGSVTCRPDD